MSNQQIIKRETHSSRAISSIVVAIIVFVVSVYLLVEALLQLLNQPALLMSLNQMVAEVAQLPRTPYPAIVILAAALLAFFGLLVLGKALAPGRRARTGFENERAAVVMDNAVIASSLARAGRLEAGLSPEQVHVVVSRSKIEVNVRPTSGIPVDEAAMAETVKREAAEVFGDRTPPVQIRVSNSGVVGQ